MNNLEAIRAWRTFASENDTYPGDTYPSDDANVDFWFASNGESANQHLHQFASTGDGSLLTIFSSKGTAFETGPVVLLGGEGDIFVLGDDVMSALALLARSGFDVLDSVISYGPEEEGNATLSTWLQKQGIAPVDDVPGTVAKATDRHSSVVAFIKAVDE